jgi:hypothetical protein
MTMNQRKKINGKSSNKREEGNSNSKFFIVTCSGVVLVLLLLFSSIPYAIFIPLDESARKFIEILNPNSRSTVDYLCVLFTSLAGLIYAFLEFVVRFAWEIPYLDIWALWTIGGVVEVWYTGRPTVFSNVAALVLFYKKEEAEIEFPWIKVFLFCYIGFGILFAIKGLIDYIGGATSGKYYNAIAKPAFGSLSSGIVMLAVSLRHEILLLVASFLSF